MHELNVTCDIHVQFIKLSQSRIAHILSSCFSLTHKDKLVTLPSQRRTVLNLPCYSSTRHHSSQVSNYAACQLAPSLPPSVLKSVTVEPLFDRSAERHDAVRPGARDRVPRVLDRRRSVCQLLDTLIRFRSSKSTSKSSTQQSHDHFPVLRFSPNFIFSLQWYRAVTS